MRVVCDSCGAVYKISDDKLVKEVNKATCKRCGHKIIIRRGVAGGAAASGDLGEGKTVVGPAPGQPPASGDERTVITTIPELQKYETGAFAPIGSLTAELRAVTEPAIPVLRPAGPVDIGPTASLQMPARAEAHSAPPAEGPPGGPSLASMQGIPVAAPAGEEVVPPPSGAPPEAGAGMHADGVPPSGDAPLFDSAAFSGDGGAVVIDLGGEPAHAPAPFPAPPAAYYEGPTNGAGSYASSVATRGAAVAVPPPPVLPPPVVVPPPASHASPIPPPPIPSPPATAAASTALPAGVPRPPPAAKVPHDTFAFPARQPGATAAMAVRAPQPNGDFTAVQVFGALVVAGVFVGAVGPQALGTTVAPELARMPGIVGTALVLVGGLAAVLLPVFNGRGTKVGAALPVMLSAVVLGGAGTFGIELMHRVPTTATPVAPPPEPARAAVPPAPTPTPVDPAAMPTPTDLATAGLAPGEAAPSGTTPGTAPGSEATSSGPTPEQIATADRERDRQAATDRDRRGQEDAARRERLRQDEERRRAEDAAASQRLASAGTSPSGPSRSEGAVTASAGTGKRPEDVLKPAVIDAIIGSNVNIRRCFHSAHDRGLDVSGKIVLKFTVSGDGSVKKSRLASAAYSGTDLEGCVSGEVNRLKFPAFDGADMEIKYPFVVR